MGMIINPSRFAGVGGGAPAGPPTFVANGTLISQNSVSSISVGYPAGLQNYDIAILHVISLNSAGTSTYTTPAGWNLIQRQDFSGTSSYSTVAFWKRLDGTEIGTVTVTQSVSVGGSGSLTGLMSIFRGCLSSGTPMEGITSTTGRNVTKVGNAITTTGPDRLIVDLFSSDAGAYGTSTPGSGWTEQYDMVELTGADKALAMDTLLQSTAASVSAESTGNGSSGSGTGRWASITFGLITN